MKKKMKMIEKEIGVRRVLCFVGPFPTLLATPATLNIFDNPGLWANFPKKLDFVSGFFSYMDKI